MRNPDELERWRALLEQLRRGPAPSGETFDLCREVMAAAPNSAEGRTALRALLHGAMADAATSIGNAQEIMRLLKIFDGDESVMAELLEPRPPRRK